jgi:predicted ATP-grasp superfamily ATP-dependent carboligase
MNFLRALSPLRAVRDLRFFLAQRKPYELWFMMLALLVTATIVFMLIKDSAIERPYKKNIIYVESWPLDRSDDQIRAQQKIDQAKKHAAEAELQRKRDKRQGEFKRLDDKLKQWGI